MRTTLVCVVCLLGTGVASGDDKPGAMGSLTEAYQKFNACASTLHKSGNAVIHLKLAEDGTTSDVKVSGTGSAELDACLAKAVSTTKFPRRIAFTLDVHLKIPTGAPSANKPGADPDPVTTTELDRAIIAEGIAKVKAKIAACSENGAVTPGGTVKAKVTVGADGKVTSATAAGSTDDLLNTCVAGAIKTATFKPSKTGGSFTYPFVFESTLPHDTQASASSELDRAMIAAGVAKVKAKIAACGDASKAGGTVKASVNVAPDGKAKATATGSSDAALNTCVAKTIETVTFDRTTNGGSFTYPFVFGTPAANKAAGAPDVADASSSSDLDRAMIAAGVAKVRAKIVACGDASKAGGTVKATVKVAPDGKAKATATGSADAALNTCVAKTIETVTFGKTTNGGSFTYPFVFGATSPSPLPGPPPPPPPSTGKPSTGGSGLDRSMISDGIAKVKAKIAACGDGKTKGVVKIKVVVAPAGTVSSATVAAAPAEPLGTCVAGVIAKATFARTEQGGTFTYPFVF